MNMNIILYTSSGNRSGGTRQALYLAQGMADRGHRVHFFVPEDSTLPELDPGRDFWRFLGPKSGWRRRIEEALLPGAANVVHAFHNAAVKKAAWWGLFWRKRAVMVAHRGVLYRPNNPLPYWSPGIDRFLVNSRACAKVLQKVGLSAGRINYVPNSVPDSRIQPLIPAERIREKLGIPHSAPLFVTVANNSRIKGIHELIHAFNLAFSSNASPRPHAIIIGVSPAMWLPVAEGLETADRMHFLDKEEDVGSYLSAGTAFVLPSLTESMPNTLLEAIRAGLPCIGTRVGAVPDILSGEDCPSTVQDTPEAAALTPCGLLVPPGDIPALAEALRRMANDTSLQDSLRAGARVQAEKYRPEKRLDLVESIYRELLQRKGLSQ